jgi:hypothetical protein
MVCQPGVSDHQGNFGTSVLDRLPPSNQQPDRSTSTLAGLCCTLVQAAWYRVVGFD